MNAPIRVMDGAFNFLCEIDDYEELVLTRRFVSFGEFEMKIAKAKANTQHLLLNNILFLDAARAGIIEHRERAQEADGESLTIKGFTLERLFNRRVTLPPAGKAEWTMTGPLESVIKALAAFNMGEGAAPERRIEDIIITPDAGRGEAVEFQTAYKPLDEELKRLCANHNAGVNMTFDPAVRRYVFDVVFGEDRTAGQAANPPVIFSAEYDTILEQSLVESALDWRNTAITGGSGEGAARKIVTVYEDGETISGIDRREVFADIRDSSVTQAALPEKGLERLKESAKIYTLDGHVNPYHSLAFERDFFLGDLVTRKYDNSVLNTRITEVTESWDAGGYSLECVFGDRMPTFLDKIKNGVI